MPVTLHDLAQKCGLNVSTVSRALSGSPLVAEATRRRVERPARKMGYSPNALARGLVTRKTRTLGLLAPDIANPFFAEWASAAEDVANQAGYAALLCNTRRSIERENLYIGALGERRVDGMLLCSLHLSNPNVDALARAPYPVVFCERELPGERGANLITCDNVVGAKLATEHLIGLGYRHIAHIAGTGDASSTGFRLRGYREALEAAGRPVDPQRITVAEYSERGGYAALRRLLKAAPEIDAVYCANDLIASGALEAAAALGKRVPGDLALVGFDDIRAASLVRPRLTTVRLPADAIGRAGMQALLDCLEGRVTAPVRVAIPPKLIVRESCGAALRRT